MKREKALFPNLIAEMARIGINKSELAQIIGISVSSIYSKLNGKTNFTLEDMEKISARFQMSLDYLFTKDE